MGKLECEDCGNILSPVCICSKRDYINLIFTEFIIEHTDLDIRSTVGHEMIVDYLYDRLYGNWEGFPKKGGRDG